MLLLTIPGRADFFFLDSINWLVVAPTRSCGWVSREGGATDPPDDHKKKEKSEKSIPGENEVYTASGDCGLNSEQQYQLWLVGSPCARALMDNLAEKSQGR